MVFDSQLRMKASYECYNPPHPGIGSSSMVHTTSCSCDDGDRNISEQTRHGLEQLEQTHTQTPVLDFFCRDGSPAKVPRYRLCARLLPMMLQKTLMKLQGRLDITSVLCLVFARLLSHGICEQLVPSLA